MENQFTFSAEAWVYNNTRLTKQIFKLLPLFEEGEDWKKQRETIILDLYGYNAIMSSNPYFMTLVAKLLALDHSEDRMVFRKLIFEAITELKAIVL